MAVQIPSRSLDDVVIRDLREQHLPVVVPMYRRAFRDGLEDRLGDRYVRALLGWFVRDSGTVARVATVDSTPIALTLGLPSSHRRRLLLSLLPTTVRCLLTRPWLLPRLIRSWLLGRRHLAGGVGTEAGSPDPVFHWKALSVDPSWQRRSLARIVSEDFASQVFRAGYRRITATTGENNTTILMLLAEIGYRAIDGGRSSKDGRRAFALDRKPLQGSSCNGKHRAGTN